MTERLTASSLPVRASGEPQKDPILDEVCPWCQESMRVLKPSGGCLTADIAGMTAHPQCADAYEAARAAASASPSDDGARQPQEDYTRQFFRKLRAFDWLSAPEAILEEDGDIGCDWFVNGATVSAHVSANGRAGWAALIGEHKSHGTFQLPDWLETFTESLRLLAAASDDGARQPTCDSCVHLTPFELAPELCTCPVLNIRIHRESASVFGCNQHEVAPKADMHYRIPHSFRAACGAPSAWGIHWTTEAAQVTCGTCLTARAAASDDGARPLTKDEK